MDKKYICEHMSYIHVRETGRIANPEGDMVLKPFTIEVNGEQWLLLCTSSNEAIVPSFWVTWDTQPEWEWGECTSREQT